MTRHGISATRSRCPSRGRWRYTPPRGAKEVALLGAAHAPQFTELQQAPATLATTRLRSRRRVLLLVPLVLLPGALDCLDSNVGDDIPRVMDAGKQEHKHDGGDSEQ